MKVISYIFPLAFLVFLGFYSLSAEKHPLDTEQKKLSYALGYKIASEIKDQLPESELDIHSVQLAITSVMANRPPLLNKSELNSFVAE